MKKWQFHYTACIVNAIAASSIMLVMIYFILEDLKGFLKDKPFLFLLFVAAYLIYFFTDRCCIKLINKYKANDDLLLKQKRSTLILLTLQGILQCFSGLGTLLIIKRSYINGSHPFRKLNIDSFLNGMLFLTFFTGIIAFVTIILLLNSIKRNHILFVESIGTNHENGVQQ